MLLKNISDLNAEKEMAVIINYNTKLVTTLALLSTMRYAGMRVLLIECDSSDGSLDFFLSLMKRYKFDILKAPLRDHGLTLDWIFGQIESEKVLLVDSDLEIKTSSIISFFRDYIDEPAVFGCGFINGPGWLNDPIFRELKGALYHERPWMPLTFLKVAPVRDAISHGKSFAAFRLDNEYSLLGKLAKVRLQYKLIGRILGKGPAKLRNHFYGLKPAVVYYDTGAQIFEYLRYEKNLYFASLPEPFHPRFVTHFFGITRNVRNLQDTHGGGGLSKIRDLVLKRLMEVYGEKVS